MLDPTDSLEHLHNALYPKQTVQEIAREQRADYLINWLRIYAKERMNSYLMDKRRCIAPHIMLDFAQQGLFALQTPEPYGGLALSQWDTVRVVEQLSAIDPTLGLFVTLQSVLAQLPVHHANPETRDYLLSRMAQGRELMGFALTEPEAGSNPLAMKSVAKPDGNGGWRLFGEKIWIGGAAWSGSLVIFVQVLNEQGKSQGMTGFVVRQGTEGLRIGEEALTLGIRAVVQNRVYLEGVPVTQAHLLGIMGGGFRVAQEAMMLVRLLMGVGCLGTMKKAMQIALRYASRRPIAGGLLLDSPISHERFSEMTAMTLSLESLLYQTAHCWDKNGAVIEDVLIVCKTMGTEFAWQTVDKSMQLLGGRGYIETNDFGQLLRDTRISRIFEGPTETLLQYLGMRVWRKGTPPLMRFMRDHLAANTQAEALKQDIARIGDYYEKTLQQENLSHAYLMIGELSAWALLLATVKQRRQHEDKEGLAYTEDWLRCAYQQQLERALDYQGQKPMALSTDEIQGIIVQYEDAIADIEQTMAGEEVKKDEFLC